MKIRWSMIGMLAAATWAQAQTGLTSAKVTEAKNIVTRRAADGSEQAAKVADVLQQADMLRTGERSLAELQFNDKTVTRLGANSIFTFKPDTREFRPGLGTTLVCVPKGQGGGKIVTAAITAAIEGTTVIVQAVNVPAADGKGPPRMLVKMIFVEGHGTVRITNPKGPCPVDSRKIASGQMISQFSDVFCLEAVRDVHLEKLLKGSAIVTGFVNPLPNWDAIQLSVTEQQHALAEGTLVFMQAGPPGSGDASGSGQGGATGDGGANPLAMSPQGSNESGIHDPPQSQPAGHQPGLVSVGGGFFIMTGNPDVPVPGFDVGPIENSNGEIVLRRSTEP